MAISRSHPFGAQPVIDLEVDQVTGRAVPLEAAHRLERLRKFAWLLDRSIPIGKWRIGLDPIMGLLPGAGDLLGTGCSLYVLYEASRLGLPRSILLRMVGNIFVELVIGAIPFLGDLFDFVWQANTRNLRLINAHYQPDLKLRTGKNVATGLVIVAAIIFTLVGIGLYFLIKALLAALPAW